MGTKKEQGDAAEVAAEAKQDEAQDQETLAPEASADEDKGRGAASAFANTGDGSEDRVEETGEPEDDGESIEIEEVLDNFGEHLVDVSEMLGEMRAIADDADEEEEEDGDMANVYERTRTEVAMKLRAFTEDNGIGTQGLDLQDRQALLIACEGLTKKGEDVKVFHNKSGTAIQLRIGKRRVHEDSALSTLISLVDADQVELTELSLAFVPVNWNEDDESTGDELSFSANDHESCVAMLNQVRALPLGWVTRDVDALCSEVSSAMTVAKELAEGGMSIISGAARCVLTDDNGNVIGLQRWTFNNGIIRSILWDDGGERAATETIYRISAVELLNEMYDYRSKGWSDFKLLPNIEAIAMLREDAHTVDGKYREKTKAAPHSMDNAVLYTSDIDEISGDYGAIHSIAALWQTIRRHVTAAFEAHIEEPLAALMELRDYIDKSILSSIESAQGVVKSDLLTRTLEQFETAEEELEEELEDEGDENDEPDFGEEEEEQPRSRATLGSDKGNKVLSALKSNLAGVDDDDDEPRGTAKGVDRSVGRNTLGNRARGRSRGGKVAGETRRSKFS